MHAIPRQNALTNTVYADLYGIFDKEGNKEISHCPIRYDKKAFKFGFHVSWATKKAHNLSSRPTSSPVTENGNIVDPVQESAYRRIQLSNSNWRPEYMRRIGLVAKLPSNKIGPLLRTCSRAQDGVWLPPTGDVLEVNIHSSRTVAELCSTAPISGVLAFFRNIKFDEDACKIPVHSVERCSLWCRHSRHGQ